MAKQFTVTDFFKRFPDDDTCLDHLMKIRFGFELDCPKCEKHGNFSRIKKEKAYQCAWCGHHIHPMAGTPFERSRTPLQKWFYAMYLFTTSRHGVPAMELRRQLGVTYKTAWRMGHEIRKYMTDTDGDNGLSGHVEIDEAYIGGTKGEKHGRPGKDSKKTAVFGMVEREGDVMAHVMPNAKTKTLLPSVTDNVAKGSTISADDWRAYGTLRDLGYKHGRVKHQFRQWKNGIHHTNSVEGFWSQLKRSINGTPISMYLGSIFLSIWVSSSIGTT